MGHKRKRESDADTTEVPGSSSSKVHVAEDVDGQPTARAEKNVPKRETQLQEKKERKKLKKTEKKSRLQVRSERRANRIAKNEEASLKNKRIVAEKYAQKVNAKAADKIAAGEDFIPLTTDAALDHILKKEKRKHESRKEAVTKRYETGEIKHRSSPRSMRKAAKAAKALALATEEYGPDITRDPGNANFTELDSKPKKAPRFICFVGNLPYSCTTEQLQSHFIKLNPKSIRHPTDKETGKSKGYAFLEFHQYDKMKTCLKLYHHSLFEPDRTEELQRQAGEHAAELLPRIGDKRNKGRMINVELTVGGGGNTDQRKKKLAERNIKLETKRAKLRLKTIKKEKLIAKKARKQANGEEGGEDDVAVLGAPEVQADIRGDIHPSRMSRVQV